MPNLRATTSKVVTQAMMTSSQPDASAIFSSSRRRASAVFNNAFMLQGSPVCPSVRCPAGQRLQWLVIIDQSGAGAAQRPRRPCCYLPT